MADLDHIQWDNISITEEDVLDPNPYLHLQNAWAALKAGRLRDVSQHLEYVQQTSNSDARVGQQYRELKDLLNPVNRLKKIYAAIDEGKIDDAVKDLNQLERSFSDDKNVQKECRKVHQEIGFTYLTEALKLINSGKIGTKTENKIRQAEVQCNTDDNFQKACSLVKKEFVILYLNYVEKNIQGNYGGKWEVAQQEIDYLERRMNDMLPSERESVKKLIFVVKRKLCEKMINGEANLSTIVSMVHNDSELSMLFGNQVNAWMEKDALKYLQSAGDTQNNIDVATRIMNSMGSGNQKENVRKQIDIAKQKLLARERMELDRKRREYHRRAIMEKENAEKRQKEYRRKQSVLIFFAIILDIPIGLLAAYIIKNQMTIMWPSILFVIAFAVGCVFYKKDHLNISNYIDILILPAFDLICLISLIVMFYFIRTTLYSNIAVLSYIISVVSLIVAYGILKIRFIQDYPDWGNLLRCVPCILIGCIGAVILKYILNSFILPLVLPFLSSFFPFLRSLL